MLSTKERDLLHICKIAVNKLEPSAEIILYGSRARGEASADSDYDLLIITEKDATLERENRFREAIFPVELDTGRVLTVILISRKEWESPLFNAMPFYKNIKKDGILI